MVKQTKTNKKILFISDNFSESSWKYFSKAFSNGNYFYSEEDNWLSFTPSLMENLKKVKEIKKEEFEIILIDYSLLGDIKYNTRRELINNIKLVEELYFKCDYLFLQGMMAKHYVNHDRKNFLSGAEIIQKLGIVSFNREDLLYDLYQLIPKEVRAEKTCVTKHVIPPKSKDSGILPNIT